MKALIFSPAAAADIEDIWDYSADVWGLEQADRYIDAIREACQAVATGRKPGRTIDVRPGYFKILTGSHVVYFRDREHTLEIIRILHGKQDVDRNL